jgi:hypothetical protein
MILSLTHPRQTLPAYDWFVVSTRRSKTTTTHFNRVYMSLNAVAWWQTDSVASLALAAADQISTQLTAASACRLDGVKMACCLLS